MSILYAINLSPINSKICHIVKHGTIYTTLCIMCCTCQFVIRNYNKNPMLHRPVLFLYYLLLQPITVSAYYKDQISRFLAYD